MTTTFEPNLRNHRTTNTRPALEIRIQLVDGTNVSFVQTSARRAETIRRYAASTNIFAQPRLVLADDYSKSIFVCSEINRVDLLYNHFTEPQIPSDYLDLVELTESEFRSHVPLHDLSRLEKREQQRKVGDLMVSFLHMRMRGCGDIYLMNETIVKVHAESFSYMQHLLSRRHLGIRLPEGGQGFINLQNLIGYTAYPGVPEIPADSWMAQQKSFYEISR